MDIVTCKSCGGTRYKKVNGFLVCEFCGSQIKIEDSRDSLISIGDDVDKLLEKCRRNPLKAKRYAKLILDLDPNNKEASKYLE